MGLHKNRVVIKVGTSTLTYKTGHLNIRRIENLVKVISDLKNSGVEIVLVTSGAIGVGVSKIGLSQKPTDIPTKQAAASIGQCELMYMYDMQFNKYNHVVSQVLLTRYTVEDEKSHTNATNTLNRLLELGVIPIINENDTVSTDEIEFGDNDTLSAIVAGLVQAEKLIILSDIDGLYTANPQKDPDAKLIPLVEEINDYIRSIAGGAGSALGTGGMTTKIHAAERMMKNGGDMHIIN
ncbi:MAG: glutamate 5-kinase, partial [Oscillospiraceae bacterium]|nr:glutamate 5-kinase [Oscillospiraceae bacterium]